MRRRRPEKRETIQDPVYNDVMVAKFINNVMNSGKKGVAEQIFYNAMNIIKEKTKGDPLELFKKAMDNTKPHLEVKSRRIGGATYQVPVEVQINRGYALATRWIIGFAKEKKGGSMAERLAAEFIAAANNDGKSVKKRQDTHKMAEANKAFAHYRLR